MGRSYGVNHGLSQERNKQQRRQVVRQKVIQRCNEHAQKEGTKLHLEGRKKKPKDAENGKRSANAGNSDPKENGDR